MIIVGAGYIAVEFAGERAGACLAAGVWAGEAV